MARAFMPHHITDDRAIGGMVIEKSLSNSEAGGKHLNYTPSASGNRRTFTLSGWFRFYDFYSRQDFLWMCGGSGNDRFQVSVEGNRQINFEPVVSSSGQARFYTKLKFRDPNWYHIVFKIDTTQANASDRYNFYVNGEQVAYDPDTVATSYPSQNVEFLWGASGVTHKIGQRSYNTDTGNFAMAELHYTSGYAYDATAFGYFEDNTGIWRPKEFTGSYGSAGWHLDFKDSSSGAALGKDKSGNGNDWTSYNHFLNPGKTDCSLFDTPTKTFPLLSNIDRTYTTGVTLRYGNLGWLYNYKPASKTVRATMALPSRGKIYMEWENEQLSNNPGRMGWGLVRYKSEIQNYDVQAYNDVDYVSISYGGSIWVGTTNITAPASFNAPTYYSDERSAMAIDCSTGDFWLGKVASNGTTTWYATDGGTDGDPAAAINKTGTLPNFTTATEWVPFVSWHDGGGANSNTLYANINFGNHSFLGTVPTGFTTLSSNNLIPRAKIYNPKQHFDILTYTGSQNNSNVVTGLQFQPDFIWIKARTGNSAPGSQNHYLVDSVRGATGSVTKKLYSNSTGAENSGQNDSDNGVKILPNGIELTTNYDGTNDNNEYVAWCWKAGGNSNTFNVDGVGYASASAAGITDGTVPLTGASVNRKAGFSIVTYDGNSSSSTTFGHGLNQAPEIYVIKSRDNSEDWRVYYTFVDGSLDFMYLNTTGTVNHSGYALPNSTVINKADDNGESMVAYCWHSVPGYSAFGYYKGNATGGPNNIGGPFVYTGFKPAFVLTKGHNFGSNWNLFDSKRPGQNVVNDRLFPNLTSAELDGNDSGNQMDMVSNGFKLKGSNADTNNNNSNFIYMAFAEQMGETPFGTEPTTI